MARPSLPDWWPAAAFGAFAVAGVVWLGAIAPPPTMLPSDDRLGPTDGMSIDTYVADAASSLDRVTDDATRWALVSLREPLPAGEIATWFEGIDTLAATTSPPTDGVRVSQVYFRVPFDRVSVPILAVDVPADPRTIARTPITAASRWAGAIQWAGATDGERAMRTYELGRDRLAADCACVIALTVRAEGDQLRALAADPRVRAVEALAADAVYGRFAVSAPIPGQEVAGPLPDDGPLPAE